MLRVQTARDVDSRGLFLQGVMTAGVHATMARAGWELKAFAPLEGAGQGTGQEVEPLWRELGRGGGVLERADGGRRGFHGHDPGAEDDGWEVVNYIGLWCLFLISVTKMRKPYTHFQVL